MPYDTGELTIAQTWPVAFQQVTVGVEKVSDLRVSSPQFNQSNDVRTEGGDVFVLGNGPALPAGGTPDGDAVESAVPQPDASLRRARTGRCAAGVRRLAGGQRTIAAATRPVRRSSRAATRCSDSSSSSSRSAVRGRRAEPQATRRKRILAELEQIYGELDEARAGPEGGGEGVAA